MSFLDVILSSTRATALRTTGADVNASLAVPPTAGQIWSADTPTQGKWITPVAAADASYLAPPLTPNAFDDEFTSGSADLAVRGWTVYNFSTSTVMTRVGPVVTFPNTWGVDGAIARNQYRSTLRDGKLIVQFPWLNLDTIQIYKAITVPATTVDYGALLWSRNSRGASFNGNSGTSTAVIMWNSVRAPGSSGGAQSLWAVHGGGNPQLVLEASGLGQATYDLTATGLTPDIFGVGCLNTATKSAMGFVADSSIGSDAARPWVSTAFALAPGNVAYAGFQVVSASLGSRQDSTGLWFVDFIRLRTGDMRANAVSGQWIYP